ncbi:uncharacterized protein LOC108985504 isoform X3 [Juglans regia]|nr:uncharacterized protein LOC108985504 isoform X3 [Juglans regia]
MTKPKTTITRDSLSQILELKRFPQELIGGSKGQRPSQKKVRWNPESELQKLDYLEKLEQRAQGQENKDEKEKKEGENEDEDENEGEEDIEEEPSDDDYFQVPKKHMLYVPDLYWFAFLVMRGVIIAFKTHIGFIHDVMALSSQCCSDEFILKYEGTNVFLGTKLNIEASRKLLKNEVMRLNKTYYRISA